MVTLRSRPSQARSSVTMYFTSAPPSTAFMRPKPRASKGSPTVEKLDKAGVRFSASSRSTRRVFDAFALVFVCAKRVLTCGSPRPPSRLVVVAGTCPRRGGCGFAVCIERGSGGGAAQLGGLAAGGGARPPWRPAQAAAAVAAPAALLLLRRRRRRWLLAASRGAPRVPREKASALSAAGRQGLRSNGRLSGSGTRPTQQPFLPVPLRLLSYRRRVVGGGGLARPALQAALLPAAVCASMASSATRDRLIASGELPGRCILKGLPNRALAQRFQCNQLRLIEGHSGVLGSAILTDTPLTKPSDTTTPPTNQTVA